jgi:RNA polymerase sigma-70 factor, ECF subfamily
MRPAGLDQARAQERSECPRRPPPGEHPELDVGTADVAEAYVRYRGLIHAFFVHRLGDADRADELTQEVFVAASACRAALAEDGRDVLPWLYKVAERRCVDELRRRDRRCRGGLDWAVDDVVDGPEVAVSGPLIAEGIRALPRGQREVLVGHLVQGSSFAEIGSELGRSEAACKMYFQRAIRTLRHFLLAAGTGAAFSAFDAVARYF